MDPLALTIRSLTVRAVDVPLARPVRTAVGAVPSAPLVLIDLATGEGPAGSAYIFAYTATALGALARLTADIGAELVGAPLAPRDLAARLDRRFRLLGAQGLVAMAVSGIEMAAWDALARAAGTSVAAVLGAAPRALPAYDSYGLIDPRADAGALEASLDRGFRAIKIKLGEGALAADVETVRAVRAILGPDIALMVDFNQSLTVPEAVRRIRAIEGFDIAWVEEPVRAEDLAGHAAVRAAVHAPIQTGENWWLPAGAEAALAVGASDLAMLDVMKIGGVTGWMEAQALCAARGCRVSSHLFAEVSAHLLAASTLPGYLEHLDLAGAILAEPVEVSDGTVTARGPGFGMRFDAAAVARFAV